MYGAIAPLVGALVTIMSGINSRLSELVGPVVAVLVIHAVGLAAIVGVSLARRDRALPGRIPAWLYLGGLIGVVTVFSSNYAFSALGASMTVAVSLLGQTMFSIAADASGFLGRARYPLSARRAPGIAVALAGVAVMGGGWRLAGPAMLVAFTAGISSGFSSVLNAGLGRRKGVLHSVRANYLVGLATTAAIAAFARPSPMAASAAIGAAGPILVLGGGLIGIVVVTTISIIVPRLPVFTFTILMFSGQTVAGVLLDAFCDGEVDWRKILGTGILLCGLALDSSLSRRGKSRPPAAEKSEET